MIYRVQGSPLSLFFLSQDTADTTREEFENGGFTLKTHETFSVHTAPEECKKKNTTMFRQFGFVLIWRKTRAGKSRDHRDVIVFQKLLIQTVFFPHENAKPAFSNSSGLKSVFEKLRQFA